MKVMTLDEVASTNLEKLVELIGDIEGQLKEFEHRIDFKECAIELMIIEIEEHKRQKSMLLEMQSRIEAKKGTLQ